jgi:DNA-binding NtrC family response regulator
MDCDSSAPNTDQLVRFLHRLSRRHVIADTMDMIQAKQEIDSIRTSGFKCLILEDESAAAETVACAVQSEGGEPFIASSIEAAKALVSCHQFDVCVLDYQLPDGNGSSFFSHLREKSVLAPCIMLTGVPEISTAVALVRNGLFDYQTKPLDLHLFLECLRRAVVHANATQASLREFGLVDSSPGMKSLRRLLRQAASNTATTILLTGETGVGKDLIARVIHQLTFQNMESSPPLISLNCSTLPADMFEAELFGAQKGAYTGAHQNRMGLVEAAQGGTLFLDEIAEVPLVLQAKLLQLLETREYRRLGSTVSQHFNGRIIAATNKHLEAEVEHERFRADLLYRLDVFNIHIPPLRERKEDISALIEVLLDSLANKYQRTKPFLRPEDLLALQSYTFPGNVRELRNIVERSLLQTSSHSHWLEIDSVWSRKIRSTKTAEQPAETSHATDRLLTPIEEQEYQLINRTLKAERGMIRRAAAKLGMSHQSLLRRLQKWPELRLATSEA